MGSAMAMTAQSATTPSAKVTLDQVNEEGLTLDQRKWLLVWLLYKQHTNVLLSSLISDSKTAARSLVDTKFATLVRNEDSELEFTAKTGLFGRPVDIEKLFSSEA